MTQFAKACCAGRDGAALALQEENKRSVTVSLQPREPYDAAIDACLRCASACERCAAACLDEPDAGTMARCIALAADCAAICRVAAATLAREGEFSLPTCLLCAEVCEACSEECSRYPAGHCRACAEACSACARACRSVSEQQ